jgi:simple sugar transport system substrate-binding protein
VPALPAPELGTADRAAFIRRAGAGAAGLSLAQLLGPAAALAGDGGGDYPAHPRWRFVFVSYDTLDPLLVPAQFGAEDAAALVRCSMQWTGSARGSVTETVAALRKAISGKADGIAVSITDPKAFAPAVQAAAAARIPLVAFDVGAGGPAAFVGESPRIAGTKVGVEIARLSARGVLLFVPKGAPWWIAARLEGIRRVVPAATVVYVDGDPKRKQTQVEEAYRGRAGVRGLFAVDGDGTLAVGHAIRSLGVQGKVHGGGWDLLPDDLALVGDGTLDFVVDRQPYVTGFSPVIQLFLAKISQGTVLPWDTETPVLLRKADVAAFLATRSRFEGSSSRHEYPLRRA